MRCDQCGVYACRTGKLERLPANCPMQENEAIYQEARVEYQKPEINNIALNAARTEAAGYASGHGWKKSWSFPGGQVFVS